MKHAVLGPGGIGGLIAALLARNGREVIVVHRGEHPYPSEIQVTSAVYGDFTAPVRAVNFLDERVDVLWVTVKSTHLETAIRSAPTDLVGRPLVVPLLNGLDHIGRLRLAYGDEAVVPAMIRTESVRVAPGKIRHAGWHVGPHPNARGLVPTAPMQMAFDGARKDEVADLATELSNSDLECQLWPEGQVVWQKLALLAPYALATTAVGGSIGMVRADPEIARRLQTGTAEAIAVARALGVNLDQSQIIDELKRYPDEMRVSMERDLADGKELEIANIADPILREGARHGVEVASLQWLRDRATERLRARG